jgi:polyamine oxidase
LGKVAAGPSIVGACSNDNLDDPAGESQKDSTAMTSAVPDPDAWISTRWLADPLSLGSYSYLAVGATEQDRAALAAPIDDRVFWAGEATSRRDPSAVHGALESGRDAARQIIELDQPGSTVVIGAGIAGLATGRALADAGLEVVVLEGRDRIGGRIWTDDALGVPVDLGGSWIHGSDGNPVSEIVAAPGIDTRVTDYDDVIVYDDGSVVPESEIVDIYELAQDLGRPQDKASEVSISAAISGRLPELTADELRAVEYALVTEVEQEFAADVEMLSLLALFEGGSYGGDDVVFPGGFAQIAAAVGDGLDVRLGELGVEVDSSDASRGVVVTSDSGEVVADRVVVTLPLGALKTGAVAFRPELAPEKIEAIQTLGMGLLDKTFLRFPHVFWDDVEIIGSRTEPGLDSWASFFNLAPLTGEPILMGFHAGSAAESLECQTDEQIVAAAMATLRSIYGDGER